MSEIKTVENTLICTCGRVMSEFECDDFDTLGADDGICCPDCGSEKFISVKKLQDENEMLLDIIKRYSTLRQQYVDMWAELLNYEAKQALNDTKPLIPLSTPLEEFPRP